MFGWRVCVIVLHRVGIKDRSDAFLLVFCLYFCNMT